jgi:hypothetical protein
MLRRIAFLFTVSFAFYAWDAAAQSALYIDLSFGGGTYNDLDSYAALWVEENGETWRSTFDYTHWIHLASSQGNVVETSGPQHRSLVFSVDDRRVSTGLTPNCYRSRVEAKAVPNGTNTTLDQAVGSSQRCVTPPPSPPPPQYTQCVQSNAECQDPLVLDLNGDGIQTTSIADPVWFDIDGDGTSERIAWTNPATAEGFLYLDLDHKGRVTSGQELFGAGTVMPDGSRGRDGFAALQVYDTPEAGGNGDGIIDSSDAVWNRLRIWIDINHNGVCEATETGPIHKYGVQAIDVTATPTGLVDAGGSIHQLESVYRRRVAGQNDERDHEYAIHAIGFPRVR